MSDYIQYPNSMVSLLTSKSKHDEAFTYIAIRNEIKDSSRTASYSQEQLAELLAVTTKTIYNYISRLKENNLLTISDKKQGEAEYPYNIYKFPELKDNYSIVQPTIITDLQLSIKEKGLLMFCKANCEKGTNHFSFKSKTSDLAKRLGIGKNSICSYLKGLEEKRHIRFIGNTLIVTSPHFPLSIRMKDYDNVIYFIIYKFCLAKNRVPPLRDNNAIGYLMERYIGRDKQLITDLNAKCKKMPQSLHLNYFCQALLNKMPTKKQSAASEIYIL